MKAETEIAIEEDLSVVRERSKQAIPAGSVGGAPAEAEAGETGESNVQRRTYRNPPGNIQGGALDTQEGL